MMTDPNAMAEAQKEIEALMGGLAEGGSASGSEAEMMQMLQAMMQGNPGK